MPKHIKPYDNANKAIVGENDGTVANVYLNRVRLNRNEKHEYRLENYESVIVMARGQCTVQTDNQTYEKVGGRNDVWDGNADSVYVPLAEKCTILCESDSCEIYIAGGRAENRYPSFRIKPEDVSKIQYGSDDTKTHRRIQHILGKNADGKCDRLLVSELFTVGQGGWSGFPPHKHDTERPPEENRFEEAYLFRFRPEQGFGAQFGTLEGEKSGEVFHIVDGSVFLIDYGYHPCVAAPGYEMYYFTIIVGEHGRSLVQYFHPDHAYQIETIPGIKSMIAGFK